MPFVRLRQEVLHQKRDIFRAVAVVGRFKGEGHKAVKLTGKVGKKEKEFVYEVNFPEKNEDAPYVPGKWAISN